MSRSNEYEFYSSCPFRTQRVQLARWVEGDEPDSKRLARYESEICWVRESETVAAYYWDDKKFKEITTTNDYYGFLTSPTLEDYRKLAERMNITAVDRLGIRAHTTIRDIPCNIVEQREGYKTKFRTPIKGLFFGDHDLFDRIKAFDYNSPATDDDWRPHHSHLQPIKIATHLTWCSHIDRDQEADLVTLREAYLREGAK